MHDLAVIIISRNDAHWLGPCLSTLFEHGGAISLDVVVVDNDSTDGTRELVEREFAQARVVNSQNRGFAYGNNSGLLTCDARTSSFSTRTLRFSKARSRILCGSWTNGETSGFWASSK